jgi:hypothetical protein
MINKAFDNDKIDGRVLKTFRNVKNELKRGANAGKRKVTCEEYLRLLARASNHLKPHVHCGYEYRHVREGDALLF